MDKIEQSVKKLNKQNIRWIVATSRRSSKQSCRFDLDPDLQRFCANFR